MRVSGLGLVPAKFDPASKMITYQVTQPLHGAACTVIIEAKMNDKKAEAQWSFNLSQSGMKGVTARGETIPESQRLASTFEARSLPPQHQGCVTATLPLGHRRNFPPEDDCGSMNPSGVKRHAGTS